MFLVEVEVVLGTGRRLDDEEITDLIEVVVDELDELSMEPSVGTARSGDDVRLRVAVSVDLGEEFDALAAGVTAVRAALHAAGLGGSGLGVTRDLRSRVEPLQPA
jgi:hypothetical protein